MNKEIIYLTEKAYLELFVPDMLGKGTRDAMLVVPGGGYNVVCNDREGEPIAMAFAARGMAAFVLHYSVKEEAAGFRPLTEAFLAVAYIRAHAAELAIDRVFAVGFSAGGHLCAALGTMYDLPEEKAKAGITGNENKIDGMVLIYPVISAMADEKTLGCFGNILGKMPETEEEKRRYSMEYRVTDSTVPAFIVHTFADELCPVQNSLRMMDALAEHHVFCEAHLYPTGPHGIALANKTTWCENPGWLDPAAARWPDDVMVWMRKLK